MRRGVAPTSHYKRHVHPSVPSLTESFGVCIDPSGSASPGAETVHLASQAQVPDHRYHRPVEFPPAVGHIMVRGLCEEEWLPPPAITDMYALTESYAWKEGSFRGGFDEWSFE